MPGLAIFGITGRMGQSLLGALRESSDPSALRLSGAVASAASARLGQDAAAEGAPTGVLVTADSSIGIRGAVVAVDFSVAEGVAAHANACVAAGIPLLVGATGIDIVQRGVLAAAARQIPVLIAPNTSLGVSVVAKLVSLAAAGLGPSYDVEIFEAHHRAKRDAPSGTALALGEAVAQSRGHVLSEVAAYGRSGPHEPRTAGSIGFSSMRAGDIVGEHTVIFAADGERVEITHRATDRITFARGALRAAEWLVGRPAGLYSMQDVLGI
ncbi:MAG: 4-hydroxy-tetrahydrodipicolinate reductase [Gammaproteobacteria bacterium]